MPSGRFALFVMIAISPALAGEPMDDLLQQKRISSSVFVLKAGGKTQKRIPIIGNLIPNRNISWLHPGKADLLVFCYTQTRFSERADGSIAAAEGCSYIIKNIEGVDYVLISGDLIQLDKAIEKLRHKMGAE